MNDGFEALLLFGVRWTVIVPLLFQFTSIHPTGKRLGFEAASDHTSTHISYSCILTTGASRQDLVDAIHAFAIV
jgi:hypothetical protein